MTSYPVNYQYDRNAGSTFDGMADSAEAARAIVEEILSEADDEAVSVPEPQLTTTTVGQMGRTREKIEDWWADEIADGWVKPVQVWGGWIAEVTYWTV